MLLSLTGRAVLVALLAFALVSCSETAPVEVEGDAFIAATPLAEVGPASKADKVTVCHVAGKSGGYTALSVAGAAVEAHLRHGDALPGSPVAGMAGYVFNNACEIVEQPCPCFSREDLDAFWVLAQGTGSEGLDCSLDPPISQAIIFADLDQAVAESGPGGPDSDDLCRLRTSPLIVFPDLNIALLVTPEQDAACRTIIADFCAANLPP